MFVFLSAAPRPLETGCAQFATRQLLQVHLGVIDSLQQLFTIRFLTVNKKSKIIINIGGCFTELSIFQRGHRMETARIINAHTNFYKAACTILIIIAN